MSDEAENTKDESGQEERICYECYYAPETECVPSYEAKQSIELDGLIYIQSQTW